MEIWGADTTFESYLGFLNSALQGERTLEWCENTMNSLLQQMGGAGIGGADNAAETPKSSRPASKKGNGGKGSSGVDATALQQAFGMVDQKKSYDLTKVLGSESLVGMLSNKEVQERLNKHMPKDEKIKETKEELQNLKNLVL